MAEAADQLLREQYHELAEIAGSLAHEIKNPLSVIRLNVDLLAEDLKEPKTLIERRALDRALIVQQQCERLQILLDDFLKFTRLQGLELRPGSLNDQIERVLEFFELWAGQNGIEIVRYFDANLPGIMLNSETLFAALLNLVKNALEAMPEGGQLTVRTRETKGGVALDLIDTGCGMEGEVAQRMFEAFYTTKKEGSGLGLPMATKIIEAHGGRIDVQSALGRGTKFTLEFPVHTRLGGGET